MTGTAVTCQRPLGAPSGRVVTFAYAGAGPAAFGTWVRALAPDIELWQTTLPGHAGRWRESFASEWPPLVDELTDAVATVVPGPVVIFGHSLGALLGFEVARALTRGGAPPSGLIASGRGAPDTAPAFAVPDTDGALLDHVDCLYGGVPREVRDEPEVLEHFLPALRADLELARAYVFVTGDPLPCPITVVTGREDAIASPAELARWSCHTRAECRHHVLPGGHFYLNEQQSAVLTLIRSAVSGERLQLNSARGDDRVELH